MEINVDIGGTFTDCFASFGDRVATGKALTTHHDLSLGFLAALDDLSKSAGMSATEMLESTHTIRYATTLGTNALIERTGPRIGLITTRGFEDVVPIGRCRSYGDGLPGKESLNLAKAQRPTPLVPRSMIVGIQERIDSRGEVVIPLDEDEIRARVLDLVDRGAHGFVVSLLWSFKNDQHERAVRDIIEDEFPAAYLGRFPVILSSEVSRRSGEYVRSTTAILDAYLHRFTSDKMSDLRDKLRERGYRGALLLVHNTGGMGSLARTTPLRTVHAGPVAGLYGSQRMADLFGYDKIVTTDMGGTSFDIGVVVKGSVRFYEFNPVVDRWRVQMPMMDIKAVGAGGGSIAHYDTTTALTVGPRSAGSMPGPACYGTGGSEPTVTDANLVLGYLNPDYYHSGEIGLDRRRAERAIRKNVAGPMDLSVVEAAAKIRQVVDGNMGDSIFKEIVLKGYDPREFVIFAFGGGGPLHACGYAESVKIPRIIVPPHSAVFSASGAAGLDLLYIYEKSEHFVLYNPLSKHVFDQYDQFNEIVDGFVTRAESDFADEGHAKTNINYSLELDVRSGGQIYVTTVKSPVLRIENRDDLAEVLRYYFAEYADRFGEFALTAEVGVSVETVRLRATIDQSRWSPHQTPSADRSPTPKAHRECYWPAAGDFESTPIYRYEEVSPGSRITGPAILEGADTTVVVYPKWRAEMNESGFLAIDRLEEL